MIQANANLEVDDDMSGDHLSVPDHAVSIQKPNVRRLLAQSLPTVSDFEAFCLDYFPDVHARFSTGMDRLQKCSLLLSLVPSGSIIQALSELSRPRQAVMSGRNPNIRGTSSLLIISALILLIFLITMGLWTKWTSIDRLADVAHAPDSTKRSSISPISTQSTIREFTRSSSLLDRSSSMKRTTVEASAKSVQRTTRLDQCVPRDSRNPVSSPRLQLQSLDPELRNEDIEIVGE